MPEVCSRARSITGLEAGRSAGRTCAAHGPSAAAASEYRGRSGGHHDRSRSARQARGAGSRSRARRCSCCLRLRSPSCSANSAAATDIPIGVAGCRTDRGGARPPRGLLRQHAGAPHRYQRRSIVLRTGRRVRADLSGGLCASGGAIRAAGGDSRSSARVRPPAACSRPCWCCRTIARRGLSCRS